MSNRYEVEVLLRPPVELCSAIVSLTAAVVTATMPERFLMPESVAYSVALLLVILGAVRLQQACSIIRYQQRLRVTPRYTLASSDIPVNHHGLFLGRGFRWTQRHTERLYATRDKHAEVIIRPKQTTSVNSGRLPFFYPRFLQKILALAQTALGVNRATPATQVGGDAALHGVGIDEEDDVFMPLSERPGHMAVIARTRHGKTRLAEVLITQDIHRRNNTVVVFDPKGDADLLKRVYIESKKANRKLIIFHLGYVSLSARYNAIGSFARITEPAGRIASSLPGEGDARAFKEFAWQYVNVITVALFALGERPDYLKIRRYISDIDPLLVRYAYHWLEKQGDPHWKSQLADYEAELKPNKLPRHEQGRSSKAIAVARYIKSLDVFDPVMEGLLSAFHYEREYFQKITAAVKPLLEKLTTGKLAEIIAPDLNDLEDQRPVLNWLSAIRSDAVVYFGLDAQADPEVAEVVGESAFSDLTSLASRLYKHGVEGHLPDLGEKKKTRIIIHADEFSDLIGPQFKTLINKAGGAGFELVLYTQTWSDVIAELGDSAKAGQLAGNIGTLIMMGVKEVATCEMLTRQLPEVNVSEVMSVSSATDANSFDDGVSFVSQNQDRISVSRVPMISPADIVALPKGQAFVLLNGCELWKIRVPLPCPSDDQTLPDDLGEMLRAMKAHYTPITDWASFKQAH